MAPILRKYFWAPVLILLTLCAWLVADSLNTAFRFSLQSRIQEADARQAAGPAESKPEARNIRYFDPIIQRNLFDSRGNLLGEEETALKETMAPAEALYDPEGPCTPTALPLELLGTVVAGDPEKSSATVLEKQGRAETKLYKVGDMALGQAQIIFIDRLRIELLNENRRECLEIPQNGPLAAAAPRYEPEADAAPVDPGRGVEKSGDDRYVVSQREIDNALENLSKLATQIRFVPEFNDGGGESVGFKAFAIHPNSLFQKIGLENGDVIQEINGMAINSPDKALRAFQMFRHEKNISIGLIRKGQKKVMEYQIR